MKKGRLNVYLSSELENWYREQAEKIGITVSSMVAVVLSKYKEEREALDVANQLINKLDELKDKSHKIL